MTDKNILTTQPIDRALLAKRMLLGACIGLIIILAFLLQVKHPRPEWGALWMIRPLIIVPLAGATGGACYYFINHLLYGSNLKKALAIILSGLVYIIGLWLGIVLGLAGTLWH